MSFRTSPKTGVGISIVIETVYFSRWGLPRQERELARNDREVGLAMTLGQHRTIASADLSGSFAPFLQFQKREIHTVFPRFWNFELAQNLSLSFLAELCGVALKMEIATPLKRTGSQ